MARRTKRRTNRKKKRSIKRSIKRNLEKSLRKTIERSIKKSLNKFNKRIKKYKKKKTKKKKIQRGGTTAGQGTGQGPGPRAGAGGFRASDATSGSGTLLQQALSNIMKYHETNKNKPIDCEKLPEELREYIQTTPAMVINSLRVNERYRGPNDEKTIMDYLTKGIPEASQLSFYKIYSQGEVGYNTFICNQYFRLGLDKIEAQRIQEELTGLNEHDKATMIQAAFRGWAQRNKLDLERKQEEAAKTIQAAYRGHAARKEPEGGQDAAAPAPAGVDPGGGPEAEPEASPQQPEPDRQPPPAQPQQPPESSCLPRPESINEIRKRIQEYKEKLRKCEQDKAELERKLKETRRNIFRVGGQTTGQKEVLMKQLAECEEKLRKFEADKQTLEARIKELKRREQELLKARLCSLLAEIRINKLVKKKDDGSDQYVDNDTDVSPDVKRRLELQGELFNIGFKYGNLIVMLVTACLLAGVITQKEAIDILKSEDLLDINDRIAGNNENAVNYLNSLKILNGDGSFVVSGDDPEHPYNIFLQALNAASAAEAEAAREAAAAEEEAEFAALDASMHADAAPADAPAEAPAELQGASPPAGGASP
jgi:hypothetical protein